MQKNRLYFAFILFPISLIYGLAVFIRNLLFDAGLLKSTRFHLPVISVGNITAGGTGKTPHVEYIAGLIRGSYRVAVLSRGYKRKTKGFLLAGKESVPKEIGDESRQIKNRFPDVIVAVDNRRVHGIEKLRAEYPDLRAVILDDAFQHRYVRPDLSIVLVDHERPVFKDFMLPLGNLRECRRNINRADTIIISKCPTDITTEQRGAFIAKLHLRRRQPVFFTCYKYGNLVPVFKGKASAADWNKESKDNPSVLLVTGIADSSPLKMYLNNFMTIPVEMRYPDHHFYSAADIRAIEKRFMELPVKERSSLPPKRMQQSCGSWLVNYRSSKLFCIIFPLK
jgi:tetraacyldisaccharide 4'-kinase